MLAVTIGVFDIEWAEKSIKIVLTVAHLDHNPTNNDCSNLKAMCQKCHNNYDKEHRKESRKNNTNQLNLF